MIIAAQNLAKQVGLSGRTLSILDGINLEIKVGESIAIVGTSGSGKSTLLGLLAGLDVPSSGKILIEDVEIGELSEDERAALRADKVGFVFQNFQLLPGFNALENVSLPMELNGVAQSDEKAKQVLGRVGLADRIDHYPKQLSGGEQQRVAIARAFATQPKILFADEPTGNLDQKTGDMIADLIFEMNHELGTTLVLVTHDLALADRCDRVLKLVNGRLEDANA